MAIAEHHTWIMQNSATFDDPTTRSGKRFRQVSGSDSPTSSFHDDDQTAVTTTQPSSGAFQTYSHRSTPDTFPQQEHFDDFSALSSDVKTRDRTTVAVRDPLSYHQDSQVLRSPSQKVSVHFSHDSRVISQSEQNSPAY